MSRLTFKGALDIDCWDVRVGRDTSLTFPADDAELLDGQIPEIAVIDSGMCSTIHCYVLHCSTNMSNWLCAVLDAPDTLDLQTLFVHDFTHMHKETFRVSGNFLYLPQRNQLSPHNHISKYVNYDLVDYGHGRR